MDMTITGIEPYYKGKGREAVYLNDKFAFVLYKGELSQYGLECGMTVDDELYEKIMRETVFPRARKRGMNLLMKMDRTESDVRDKLSEGGYPPEAVDDAIAYLQSFHYIDDTRYASEYIRCKSGAMSRKQITQKLSQKGVDKSVIEEAFAQFDEENNEDNGNAEKQLIRKLILKRCPQGVTDLDYNAKQKLYAYLYGKGFSVPDIETVVTQLMSDDF